MDERMYSETEVLEWMTTAADGAVYGYQKGSTRGIIVGSLVGAVGAAGVACLGIALKKAVAYIKKKKSTEQETE